jgi:hypothetical protein
MRQSSKWIVEGSKINDFSMIYVNGIIKTFLTDPQKNFIIAGKGIGKTVLLNYKRSLMEKKTSGVLILPSTRPFVDFVNNLSQTLSSNKIEPFSRIEFCENFWRLALQIYLLSQTSIPEKALIQLKKDTNLKISSSITFDEDFDFLFTNKRGMESVFDQLMNMGYNKLKELFSISPLISDLFKQNIQEPIYYFFDRFDQALKYTKDEIWYAMQQGLLEAAWNIMRDNAHVKIYLSLRQEAYDAYSSINKESMASNISLISYTSKELFELLIGLVEFYEDKVSLEDFLGIDTFYNSVIHDDEPIYQFMNRYSIGRPRDFIMFCGKLSEKVEDKVDNKKEYSEQLKNIIITASSSEIISGLHTEVRMLLKYLDTQEKFDGFVKLLSRNVLTYKDLQKYCKKYNGAACSKKCADCKKDTPDKIHPFCDLYIMGLLGRIQRKTEGGELRQVFKSPYENITKTGIYGDTEKYYLIHPALRFYIKSLKNEVDDAYELYSSLLIGDGLPWTEKDTYITVVHKNIDKIRNKDVQNYLYTQLDYFSKEKNELKYYSQLITEYKTCFTKKVSQRDKKIVGEVLRALSNDKDKRINVFITYAYESEEYKEQVIGFTNKLREMGYDATMDEYMKREYPNIDAMMVEGLKCDKVIVVLSELYKEKADNIKGSGVWKEFLMIANHLEKDVKKFIFISFDPYTTDLPERITPTRLGNRWFVDLEKDKKSGYNELISYITDVNEYPLLDISNSIKKVREKKFKKF